MVATPKTVGRILRLLFNKSPTPADAGYIFRNVNVPDDDVVDSLLYMEKFDMVSIECGRVLLATIEKKLVAPFNKLDPKIMDVISEHPAYTHIAIAIALNTFDDVVVSHLYSLEKRGIISLRSMPMEFISLTGGRWYILKTVLKNAIFGKVFIRRGKHDKFDSHFGGK